MTYTGDLSWDWLYEIAETVDIYDFTKPDEIIARADNHEIVITNKTRLPKEILDSLHGVKYIGLLSTGFDAVDVSHARTLGIPVCNIPAYSTNGVAQMTFALILEFTNRVALHDRAVKDGEWQRNGNFCFMKSELRELYGKTLGIVGYGRIGRAVAKIAEAFGMSVLCNTAHPEKYKDENVQFTTLSYLLKNSDFVSLHCPYNESTHRLVNSEFLSSMKPTAFLVNTSRGAVVDEDALSFALDNKIIAGAGVDVLSTEPPKDDNKIAFHKKCIVTPHISWAAFETRERLMGICKNNLLAFINGKPINVVN